jgi:RNase P subunit RPR2
LDIEVDKTFVDPAAGPSPYPAIGLSVNLDLIRVPYDFPGMGSPSDEYCGTVIRGAACSRDPGHWSRPHPVNCNRLSCPRCWSHKVGKTARNASDRFRGFLDALRELPLTLDGDGIRTDALKRMKKRASRPLHAIFSPPPDRYPPDTPLEKIWKDAIATIKASGLLAGYVIFHPARLPDEVQDALRAYNRSLKASGKPTRPFWDLVRDDPLGLGTLHDYATWSPHFHVLGIGFLENAKAFHQATGWIYKNKRPGGIPLGIEWNEKENRFDDDVTKLLSYLMTHAAYVPGKRALRTFGYLNSKHVKKVGKQIVKRAKEAVCPVCGAPIVRYLYRDERPERPWVDEQGECRQVICRICGYNYKFRV